MTYESTFRIHRKWLTNKLKGGEKRCDLLCVWFRDRQLPVPRLYCASPFQAGPWINNQARRVSRTRWRGSLGSVHSVLRTNRVTLNPPSLSLRLTSSRSAEATECLCMFTECLPFFSQHIFHCLTYFFALVRFRSSTQIAVWATVFALWTTSVSLPKWKSLRRWVCWLRSIFVVVWWTVRSLLYLLKSECICCSACSGGCMEKCGRHADSRAATRGQTCCPAAAQGHYTGAGIKTQHTHRHMQKASVCFLFLKKSLFVWRVSDSALWEPTFSR